MKKAKDEIVKMCSFRLTEQTLTKLNELCDTYSRNKTQMIEALISAEYMKSTEKGKEEIKAIMRSIDNLANQLNDYAKQ